MAGDWIKMGKDLLTHPKVVRMSYALNADRLRTVGGLFAVWCLFDTHSTDGQLSGYTPDALDELAGFKGISSAMEAVGWLSHDADGVNLPVFERHNGQSAKRRAQETERKRLERNLSAPDADEKRTREEKRREEKNSPSLRSGEAAQSAAKTSKARGTRLPDDWFLPKAWGEWAAAEFPHWTADVIRIEAEKFRDHWRAKTGKDATKADWLATWRNWCRSAIAQRAHAATSQTVNKQEAREQRNRSVAEQWASEGEPA